VLTYLFGLWFSRSFVLIFIVVTLEVSADFYFVKNIGGRRLVGLRWWNEPSSSSTTGWVFEAGSGEPNPTDARFFWLGLYLAPLLWALLAVVAVVRFELVWLSLVAVAAVLALTNAVAFSRADRFASASTIAGSAMRTGVGGWAARMAGRLMWGR